MPVPRITKEELKSLLDADPTAVVVVDARLKYPYEHSTVRLPDAVRFQPGSTELTGVGPDRDIVLYDSDPEEITARSVAALLIKQGYRARVLEGGIAAWVGANLPIETKDAPKLAAPAGAAKS
ncbi:MAG TPA: rhodanese-like domain-containing protein [Vicinamibacterales bacterium]|nr:rhodanese-like domain-containing protein [Vicinamibacterales bacterium]